ncbi:MAG: hypothetical protein N4A33_07715 [Bacteriovoracaceae bacterium]|jgi:hypothetical protein|nr:hypothetical protein [Bacteriovoracaceae bacterium]
MKKIIVLSCLLILSAQAKKNLCFDAYIYNFYAKEVKKEKKVISELFKENISEIRKIKDLRQKLDLIEREYNFIFKRYHIKLNEIQSELEKTGKALNLSSEDLEKVFLEKNEELFRLYADELNELMFVSKEVFDTQGLSVTMKNFEVLPGKKSYYLEINNKSNKKFSNSFAKIGKYKKRFGTESVTFDLTSNMISGTAGFSLDKRIELGIRGMRNILIDDLLTVVGKHEFTHAAFISKRTRKKASVYHADYSSNGGKALSEFGGYDHYMSAEELYTFANESFWGSTRIRNIKKYNPEDYLNDLNGINREIREATLVAKQVKEVSRKTIKELEKTIDNLKKGKGGVLTFWDDSRIVARTKDDVTYVAIPFGEGEFTFTAWVQDATSKKYVDKIMDDIITSEVSIMKKHPSATPEKLTEAAQNDLRDALIFGSKNEKIELLEVLLENQKTLNKVATEFIDYNEAAVVMTETFIKDFNKQVRLNPNYLLTKRAQTTFDELGKSYRELGNLVKEDYKKFLGKL